MVNTMFENEQVASQKASNETDLRDFKNINSSLMQDALNIWSDLWAELDYSKARVSRPNKQIKSSSISISETDDGFSPSCGCSEFAKKMWVLRSYLDFARRLSR
jgi:hypothetical protein